MLVLKSLGGLIVAVGLIFLIWKFLRWIILALVLVALLLVGYYLKFHHWPAFLTSGYLHQI
ncbi:MAG TPA: hypothetical protein VLE93_01675 [Candidatus Saccharimonadales bacterium]|nr:hypothetical protein [Candidatus Saccharimonadales bacterium]